MPVFENFPYTNFHDLNLDWILNEVKALDNKVNNDLYTEINNYITEHLSEFVIGATYDPVTETIVFKAVEE